MKPTTEQNRMMKMAALVMFALAEASAQEDKAARRIVVSIPDRKLVLLENDKNGGVRILKVYDVAVGKPSTPSPHGDFKIITHIANPTWYGPNKTVAPGPDNPVGTRWMGLSASGYGIHGTNVPSSIGKAASHGCIRMRNRDVEELFELVHTGVTVELDEARPEIVAHILANQTAQIGPAE